MPKLKIPSEHHAGLVAVRALNDIPDEDNGISLLEEDFQRHADLWLKETAHLSSIRQSVMHPSYQRIIGMGRPALPFIFERLAAEPNHWFWALRSITGEDPVSPADAGHIKKMAEAWLKWARERLLTT